MVRKIDGKEPESKEVWCTIIDAVHKEDLGTEENPTYNNSIFMRLMDIETKSVFTSNLSSEAVQQIAGLSRAMSSREMIHFAQVLRERTEPVRMLLPEQARIVDTEAIIASEELDNGNKPIELEDDNPVVSKIISKFSIKNKKERK